MSSTPFMLNPVPMTFKLKSFEIVLDFKDNEDIMTLKVSEQKGPPADVVNLTVRDKNHFAVFLGFKFEEGEANDDISNDNMEFSATGTLNRDEDLVSFALMWVDKLISEEHKDIMVLNVGGRMTILASTGNEEAEASNQESENPQDGINFGIDGPLNDTMRNFADLMDHFLQ